MIFPQLAQFTDHSYSSPPAEDMCRCARKLLPDVRKLPVQKPV